MIGLRSLVAGAVAVCLPVAAPALAHAGFLVPVLDASDTTGEVILYASFSDDFPETDIALRSQDWTLIPPSGAPQAFDKIASSRTRTALQAFLEDEGTYRLSSGERLGRKGQAARIEGELFRLGGDGLDADNLPDGAQILTAQTATVSDLYITRGEPTPSTWSSRIGRLAIMPLSNPTGLAPGDGMDLAIRFDAQPMADMPVTVFVPAGSREEGVAETTYRTDDNGEIRLACDTAGAHLAMVRHLAMAPQGAQTDVRSYTTTLTVICE